MGKPQAGWALRGKAQSACPFSGTGECRRLGPLAEEDAQRAASAGTGWGASVRGGATGFGFRWKMRVASSPTR